ncbi:uncharacterized protein L3040_003055 [Drepanopeziza brunnea f. sp. 'multigermtubi']|uniref:Glycosyltransferase family 31 protein n=1 Tax=Marssonina brunnea f. sp. multigermtubi (strain MB_m1) TaxID=1072389 RepID=K1W7Z2_MARBU|nr:uncharacterized protein MBM_08698 [Drepanopeziza brunnea f. sp. 'multigermtubi' MB_m1]EKD13255.1 hypothetical protein MBM_08698 [Drepanopeziza brunnea f. sp. 'multigermtubi' MB_m1]KAJ5047214.1 hypothetical protein L3040_003055 [Drepanopeziza brunnea f. sp. 'multigermtubi']
MGPRRPLLVVLFLAAIGTFILVSRRGRDGGHITKVDSWIRPGALEAAKGIQGPACSQDLEWMEPFQFSHPIKFLSRDIIAVPAAHGERPSLSIVGEPLFSDHAIVDLAKSTKLVVSKCLPPLHLEVPQVKLPPVDASNMIFGLQTTIGRLKDTVKHLARWLPHTGARLFAIVIENEETPAGEEDMAKLEADFHDLGMDVTVIHPVRPIDLFAQRYFSLVNVMYSARNEKTEWIITIDDDTFFPSMHDLQALLKHHDPRKPQYIGSLSEDWWAVNHYGLMGFGGAGIMISLPLAKIIDDHRDECKEHPRTTAGDITIMDCVYRFSSTKLTHVPGLHQVDMHGDLSGFYESGREMISLHHWKEGSATGFKLEMEKMHLVADICDSCFLQRWQFPNELILSNGFSIAYYPKYQISGQKSGLLGIGMGSGEAQKINLEEMEHTWGDDINVLHSLAPTREKMAEDAKMSYKLLDSFKVADGVVRQVYFREGGVDNQDTVMVLNWKAAGAVLGRSETKSV